VVTSADLLCDLFGRVREAVHDVLDGLAPDELAFRPARANSIAWLVWHLTRIQDDHVADAAGLDQVWTASGWAHRMAFPFDPSATGYGHSNDEVGAVRVDSAALLSGYHDAVYDHTIGYVSGLTDEALARIVDRSWDPPVTLGVRLVSVIADDLQHVGQAAYVRGLLLHE